MTRILDAIIADVHAGKVQLGELVDTDGHRVHATWPDCPLVADRDPYQPRGARELDVDVVYPPHPGRFVAIEPAGPLLFVPAKGAP